jgi:hypothetical protein
MKMKSILITCLSLLTVGCSIINNQGLVDNSQILTPQVHVFSEVPKDLVDNLGKMGMDDSIILNDQEGQYLNFVFKTEAQGINLAGKKVAFLGSKVDYFESTRKDSIVVGGSSLYLFNTMQKTESGGYDAAVTYWEKFVIPTQEIVRTLKDNTKE